MKPILLIGWKDLQVTFRDRAALLFMLLAPFLLTLGLALVSGQFSEAGRIEQIPVAIANQDDGQLGQALVKLFQDSTLADLVSPTVVADSEAARRLVDQDQAAAAVIVSAGFTASIVPDGGAPPAETVAITLVTNPARPIGAGIVRAIVEEYLSRVETGRVGGEVIVRQLVETGRLMPQHIRAAAPAIGSRAVVAAVAEPALRLRAATAASGPADFNPMAVMAPGMALLFLMFTVANGGRSLLAERAQGTLPRLLVAPVTAGQVLVGKLLGTYLAGVAQMLILVVGSALLFGLRWGDPLGVLALILAAVFGALGWGMLLTALARTPGQVTVGGAALMLIFGLLGGSFVQFGLMPGWWQALSHLTPNAWGLDGFTVLSLGGTLADLGRPLLGLVVMGLALGAVSLLLFSRRSPEKQL
ncbi:MAG: ABC transporter permease [Anaerolineae bacterium]|nr:ABC transporter permease [Anaerolineae bacterium]